MELHSPDPRGERKQAGKPAPFDLDAAMVTMVSRGAVKVPPYPAVALQVDRLVKNDDYSLDQLAKLVSSDQVLAADALRVANSAFYARAAPVTSLGGAISRIGGREMARLAVASGLGAHARKPGPLAALKRRCWLEGLASAALCQELARHHSVDTEEAFVCGLLHDFGRMIAIACVEEIVEQHPDQRPMPIEHWLEVVDRYHVELGLVLAARWELPPIVSDAISLHHSRDWRSAADPRLVELTIASDEVVRLLGESVFLTPEDLESVSLLTPEECRVVASVLERLPAFIASFEGDAPPAAPGRTLVEPEGDGHTLILQPFALNGAAHDVWKALLRKTTS